MGRATRPISSVREGECLRCTSHRIEIRGYPIIRKGGRRMPIARWILFQKYGRQSSSVMAQHTCGHKWCIEPNHIVKGTVATVAKTRAALKHNRGNTKLSPDQVTGIRALLDMGDISQAQIARMFGVTPAQITHIKQGKCHWR